MVGKIDKNDQLTACLGGKWACKRNVDMEQTLAPGDYLIAVEVEWNNLEDIEKRFSVSAYSSE